MAEMNPTSRVNPSWKYGMPPSSFWLFAVLGVQTLCQLGLLFEILSPFRVLFRSGAFGMNFVALLLAQGLRRQPHHPAFWFGIFCSLWMALEIAHPDTNTAISAIASWGLTLAVLAPLFWVPRLQINLKVIRTVIILMWAFHTLSSIFGVLQVYYPGNFQPALSANMRDNELARAGVSITLVEGTTILRPMGLTDLPGGAAIAGLYAFVFGLGLFAQSRGLFASVCGLISLPVGLFCIYLTEVRVMFVLAVIISIVYAVVLALTGRLGSAVRVAFAALATVPLAFLWAIAMGGENTMARFQTLIEDNPNKVYYNSRGRFLEDTIDRQLPEYPFGAGLGRWGMTHAYFGDPTLEGSDALWSEIQWTSWIYDGGIILMIAYPLAIFIAIGATARVAFQPQSGALAGWAMLILAYDVAIFAFTFSAPVFASQSGVEFWLLNAMIWAAAQQLPRRPAWRAG